MRDSVGVSVSGGGRHAKRPKCDNGETLGTEISLMASQQIRRKDMTAARVSKTGGQSQAGGFDNISFQVKVNSNQRKNMIKNRTIIAIQEGPMDNFVVKRSGSTESERFSTDKRTRGGQPGHSMTGTQQNTTVSQICADEEDN